MFDDDGRAVVGREGELVLTAPLPSMPVELWDDPSGDRDRRAYFDRFPGGWAHGDRATVTDRGTCVIIGRSDGTLNRGGVRMGTAEFYRVVEGLDRVADSLVLHLEDPDGGPGELWLFVVPGPAGGDGPTLGDGDGDAADLPAEIAAVLRRDLSPRPVPDRIVAVAEIPRTLSGKKLEVPLKRILAGADPAGALSVAALANPDSLEPFLALAATRREARPGPAEPVRRPG